MILRHCNDAVEPHYHTIMVLLEQETTKLIQYGKNIQALQLVRAVTGHSLKDSKDYVDALKMKVFYTDCPRIYMMEEVG